MSLIIKPSLLFYTLAVFLLPPAPGRAAGLLRPVGLKCNYAVNPLGIDDRRPRLSWRIDASVRGERQTAYRVRVASSPAVLAHGRGDRWDTGRVASSQSIQVEYAGKPLASFDRCWWQVRVWDRAGRPSPWSAPATWSMGLLNAADWRGRWLAYTPPVQSSAPENPALTLSGSHWIWFPEGNPQVTVPAAARYFRRDLTLPPGVGIRQAQALITADDQFVLYVNGKAVGRSDGRGYAWQRPIRIDLKPFLVPGANRLAVEATNAAPSPAGLIGKFVVETEDGRKVTLITDGSWQCSDTAPPGWQTVDLPAPGWQAARDLGEYGVGPWNAIPTQESGAWWPEPPAPIFRKEFAVRKRLQSAVLTICGVGYYEARLNGVKVGDHVLDPAFTRFDRRCLYATYDVTARLRPGRNALGVMLGNGFYNSQARDAWDFDRAPWRGRPRMIAQLRLEYRNGTTDTVVSDGTWRAAAGPVLHNATRNGEEYDARRESGWDRLGYNDRGWAFAEAVSGPGGVLQAQEAAPIRVMQTLRPVRLTRPQPGVFVFDMGQDFAGWARLRVTGPAGTRVMLRFGERLDPQGMLTQAQIAGLVYSGPFQTDTYILRGGGREEWEPRFTYHGFRYVEVRGFPGTPTLESLQGRVIHTAFTASGSFTCSDPLLNAIQRLTLWSYRSNFVGIPTDCPQREKNGWTGDAHLAAEQAMYNWDNAAGYVKWMNDFHDAQRPNGELPGIVPTSGWGYGTGPAWDSAYVLIPWYLYRYQGDTHVLAAQYEGMKRFVDYLGTRATDHIVSYGLGDWVPYKTETPAAVTSTGYYAVDALLLSRVARLLGKTEDAARYAQLAGQIREAFRRTFIRPGGLVANDSQTAMSCAVYQGLAAPADRPAIVSRLAADVQRKGNHLDTGILGAKYLFHVLSDNGYPDLAYQVASQTTEPSYGDWVRRGATTLWEDWRGAASLDHIMFGDISAWFYQTLAGIQLDPDAPAFQRVIIHPRPVGDLKWVQAWHDSPYGRIRVAWSRSGSRFTLAVTIPPNSTAVVYVPARSPAGVTESGRPAAGAPGVRFMGMESLGTKNQAAVYAIASGSYLFETR